MSYRWRMWVGITAVFLCGVVLGGAGGHLLARHQAMRHISKITDDQGAFLAEIAMRRLETELDLTDAQNKKIKPLVVEAYRQGHIRLNETRMKMDDIFKSAMSLIIKNLNQKQVDKLDRDQPFRILLPPPPPGGPPGPRP